MSDIFHDEFTEYEEPDEDEDNNASDLDELEPGIPYARCPFCNSIITPLGGCEHVILLYSTVNSMAEDYDPDFIEGVLKSIGVDPEKYFEDYTELLDIYYDGYDEDEDPIELYRRTDKAELVSDAADFIRPEILEALNDDGVLETKYEDIYEFAHYDAYIGGGTYMYLAKTE